MRIADTFFEEMAAEKVKEITGLGKGELKGKANKVAGEAKGKASEVTGKAKGKVEEMKGM